MKISLLAVSSLDGRITKGNNPNIYKWTSTEDFKLFRSIIESHNLIVMGSATYEVAKRIITPKKGTLRIVLTRSPKRYTAVTVKDQLEFHNVSARRLVGKAKTLGYTKMVVVGGSAINGLFLKDDLIDEVLVTIEPRLFGSGKPLIDKAVDVRLRLQHIKKLNTRGTVHLRYAVVKSRRRV